MIFREPILTSTANSLESAPEPAPPEPAPEPKDTRGEPRKGLPPLDLTVPRNAWLSSKLKEESHVANIVQDGDFDRVDPVHAFTSKFPPIFFIRGLDDPTIPSRISEQALEMLKKLEVETEIALVPEDPQYQYVRQVIEFLKQHA